MIFGHLNYKYAKIMENVQVSGNKFRLKEILSQDHQAAAVFIKINI